MSHELRRALDDQLFGIAGALRTLGAANTDALLAYLAVVEGSATITSNRWMLQHGVEGDDQKTEPVSAPMWIWKPFLAS